MPEYLDFAAGKFTFRVATDRRYTAEGAWAFWLQTQDGGRVRVGLTDYLQQHSGDVAFVSVKPVGTKLAAGDDLAEVETMKALLVLASPLSGTVVEVNPALELTPEIVNQDPYDKGWLVTVEPSDWEPDLAKLLEPQAYFSAMQGEIEKELKRL